MHAATIAVLRNYHSDVCRALCSAPSTAFSRVLSGIGAVYDLATLNLLAGSLPLRQQRLVQAWAELHFDELIEDWNLLQQGRRPNPIIPLQ